MSNNVAAICGLSALFVLGLLVFAATKSDAPPHQEPLHEIRTVESETPIPMHSVEKLRRIDAEDFQLVQLADGHDYWLYHKRGGDSGYAAMAHSPECVKCATTQHNDGVRGF